MDGERNIVQTVLKANNTFKDFSLSASFPLPLHTHINAQTHTHTHINLPLFLAKRMKLSAGQQQQAAGEARERQWGEKRDIQRIYGNEEWREALREAGT